MYKIIKTYGNAYVIRLTPDDMKIHGWKKGDVLDMGDTVKITKKSQPRALKQAREVSDQ